MGNRGGVIHNAQREIVRRFKSRQWIVCVLEFKGRRRQVMTPGLYTELFFLDEAVALAAGHRPCAECRRDRFNAFRDAWMNSHRWHGEKPVRAPEMDLELHQARIDAEGRKVTFDSPLNVLPDGCLVKIDDAAWLVRGDALFQWSPEGYTRKLPRPTRLNVTVLTPQPAVQCIRRGYVPLIHASADAL
ncbi:MAG TPA: hypothetical protein VG273_23585 [Bryobacteraceae bacterium]|jgi:hypothetical protein|nr:hypothetical protein [Bryobacteraceae bacterium]